MGRGPIDRAVAGGKRGLDPVARLVYSPPVPLCALVRYTYVAIGSVLILYTCVCMSVCGDWNGSVWTFECTHRPRTPQPPKHPLPTNQAKQLTKSGPISNSTTRPSCPSANAAAKAHPAGPAPITMYRAGCERAGPPSSFPSMAGYTVDWMALDWVALELRVGRGCHVLAVCGVWGQGSRLPEGL